MLLCTLCGQNRCEKVVRGSEQLWNKVHLRSRTDMLKMGVGYQVRDIALAMKIGAHGQSWQKMTLERNNHYRLTPSLYVALRTR